MESPGSYGGNSRGAVEKGLSVKLYDDILKSCKQRSNS